MLAIFYDKVNIFYVNHFLWQHYIFNAVLTIFCNHFYDGQTIRSLTNDWFNLEMPIYKLMQKENIKDE